MRYTTLPLLAGISLAAISCTDRSPVSPSLNAGVRAATVTTPTSGPWARIVEGETGLVAKPRDSLGLARTIERFFSSELFHELDTRRVRIREYANERYSWSKVAAITTKVYSNLLS